LSEAELSSVKRKAKTASWGREKFPSGNNNKFSLIEPIKWNSEYIEKKGY